MKSLLTVFACLCFSASFAQMDVRLQDPGSFSIDDVTYIDSVGVFICGSNYFGTTIDNGHTWYSVGYGGMFVRAAAYPSIRFGIGVGDGGKYRTNKQCGYFWGWSSVYSVGTTQNLKDVDMPNEIRAMVVGVGGTLVSTHDQAQSWTTLTSGTSNDLNGVKMINDSVAFACGNGGIVLKIVNDVVVSSTVLNASIQLNKITFATDSLGFIVGNSGRVYRTTDQGLNWAQLPSWGSASITNVDFSSPTHGAICGTNNFMYYTNDGGLTWTLGNVYTYPDDLEAIAFENDLEGYATGSNFIMRTIDGGANWNRYDLPYRSVDFTTPNDGYAIGYSGAKRTKDGGNSWEVMNLTNSAYYTDINFTDQSVGVVTGSQTISQTTDGGDTWTTLTHPATTGTFLSNHFTSANHGVVVGTKKTILHTNNGGATWSYSYQSSSTLSYSDVTFTNPNTGYICSGNSTFLKTTNGGASWTTTYLPVNVYYTKLFFLNDNLGWAIGNSGTILKTTNGGASWVIQNSGVTEGLSGIHFKNANEGIIVGSNGTYLSTTNGGATWVDYSYGSTDYTDLDFTSDGIGFAVTPYRILSLGRPTLSVSTDPNCPGENRSYNSFEPYYDNATVRNMAIEFDTENGDFSGGNVLTNVTIDSVGYVSYQFPDTLTVDGIYKTRFKDLNDPSYISGERFHRIIVAPSISFSLVGSNLIAQSNMTNALFYWYYRPNPQASVAFAGSGDTLAITAEGEYRVQIFNACCTTTTEWTNIVLCGGNYINQSDFTYTTTATICSGDSILWENDYYGSTGVYNVSFTNQAGCDSIQVLDLTVLNLDSTSTISSICYGDSLLFNGSYFSQSGIYIDTLTNINSCDSIISLDLTVFPYAGSQSALAVCFGDSALFNSNYLTQSGTYFDTLTSVNGCDSIIEFDFSVLPLVETYLSEEICNQDSLLFSGTYLTQSGTYIDSLTTTAGCDSIVNLTLIVNQVNVSTNTVSICEGDSSLFNGTYYSATGNYTDTLVSSAGCDSIVTLDLTVYPTPILDLGPDHILCAPNSVELDAGAGFTNYLWSTAETSQTISVTSDSMDYWVIVTNVNGCSNSDTALVAILDCSLIDELEKFDISIYPNPSSGVFYVKSPKELKMNVFDETGRLISEHTVSNEAIQIELPVGKYELMFFGDAGMLGAKSIVVIE